MKKIGLLILLTIIFPFSSIAQLWNLNSKPKALKGLNRIVLETQVENEIFAPLRGRKKTYQLASEVGKRFKNKFDKLFDKLDIEIIDMFNRYKYDPKPPILYTRIYFLTHSPKSKKVGGRIMVYLVEPGVIARNNQKNKVITWFKQSRDTIEFYSLDNLEDKITNKLDELVKEFELDYYRANK